MPKPRCTYVPPEFRVPGAPGYEQGVVPPMIGQLEESTSSGKKKKKTTFDPFANLPDDGCPFTQVTQGAYYRGLEVLFPNGRAA